MRKKILLFIFILIFIPNFKISEIFAENPYPESYSLFDNEYNIKPGNQGQYSTCWAFSAMDSISMQINKTSEERVLSPWYLVYSAYRGSRFPFSPSYKNTDDPYDIFYYGGTNLMATALITGWEGYAYESDIPYASDPDNIAYIKFKLSEENRLKPDYIVNDIYNITPWVSKHRNYETDYIKYFIYDNKTPVSSTCTMNSQYFETDNFALFCSDENYNSKYDKTYHSVLIIGWNDNYPRENFINENMPSSDGAWLVRSSYGQNWGQNGCFWISYEDKSLTDAVVFSSVTPNKYKNIYQYDNYGWSTSLPASLLFRLNGYDINKISDSPEIGYMANLFTATEDECISAVSFYTADEYTEYEISVYTDISDVLSPLSGKQSPVTKGSINISGYHTLTLDRPVPVRENSRFSVVIKIKNSSSVYTIPVDAKVCTVSSLIPGSFISNIENIYTKRNRNKSFISYNGVDWIRCCDSEIIEPEDNYSFVPDPPEDEELYNMIIGNVCLKAFSEDFEKICQGDIDGNGIVNTTDLVILKQYILNPEIFSEYLVYSDINNDGKINAADIKNMIIFICQND